MEQEPHDPRDTPEKFSKYYIVSIFPSKYRNRKTNLVSYSPLLQQNDKQRSQNANTWVMLPSRPVKRSSPAAPPRLSAGK